MAIVGLLCLVLFERGAAFSWTSSASRGVFWASTLNIGTPTCGAQRVHVADSCGARFPRAASGRSTASCCLMAYKPNVPNFCSDCGSDKMELRIPENDERLRAVCGDCGHIEYSNPKVVVSCVVWSSQGEKGDSQQQQYPRLSALLGKRSIEPRAGYWGIPQGFMEHGETTREAAIREVNEETGATVKDLKLRGIYNVPGSIQILYEGWMVNGGDGAEAGHELLPNTTLESSEIRLFDVADIPYDELCFPTVKWALEHCLSESDRVQQKNKFYDPDLDQWCEFEDERID